MASDFTDLNFVVEHCGLPRLEDFCWIATQEPNVYGGLAVAMPFIHTRPKYFAQIMGELLYWIGEDRIHFSSDYALWTPRWLIEAFVDFNIPDDLGEYAADHHRAEEEDPRAQRRQALRHPGTQGTAAAGRRRDRPVGPARRRQPGGRVTHGPRTEQAVAALDAVVDPELDEPITDLGFVRSLVVTRPAACDVKVHLRLPTSFCSPNFAYLMASDAKDALAGWIGRARWWSNSTTTTTRRSSTPAWLSMPGTGARSVTRRRSPSTSYGRRSGAKPTPPPWSAA